MADANGVRKLRPAGVVAPTAQILPGTPFDVVASSSRLADPLPDDHVLLSWHRSGHPRTGLNRRCAAVCSWLNQITDDDVEDSAGLGPAAEMRLILARVATAGG